MLHLQISTLKAQNASLLSALNAELAMRRPALKIPTINQGMDGGLEVNCRRRLSQGDMEELAQYLHIFLRNMEKGYVI